MRVALGTIEIDDDTRKKIRKALGNKGHATRGEVKDFLIQALESDVIPGIGQDAPAQADPPTTPGEPGTLPEPTAGGTTAGVTGTVTSGGDGTTPSVGNLGSDGTPGGSTV